jgi:DNA-binding NarL/FixJ family response regulator
LTGSIVITAMSPQDEPDDQPTSRAAGPDGPQVTLRVLIVEDEPLVAMELAAVVEDAGHVVIGPASTCAQALELAASHGPHIALLDGNLNGERVDDVANVLSAQGMPFGFVSGYGKEHLPAAHNHRPIAAKPFLHDEIENLLQTLIAESRG